MTRKVIEARWRINHFALSLLFFATGCAPNQVLEVEGKRSMSEPKHEPRNQYVERDVLALTQDDRLMAVTAYQLKHYPNNIVDTDELIELWLGRKLVRQDYDGARFVPAKANLTQPAFTDAWSDLFRRIRQGSIEIRSGILEEFSDIRDYLPKKKLGDQ